MKRNGFTLLELVVAIGIMGILLGIGLPSLQSQAQYLHRLAAETKLLSWQVSGIRPTSDRYYQYHKLKRRLIASREKRTTCSELVLTDHSQEPSGCWPESS